MVHKHGIFWGTAQQISRITTGYCRVGDLIRKYCEQLQTKIPAKVGRWETIPCEDPLWCTNYWSTFSTLALLYMLCCLERAKMFLSFFQKHFSITSFLLYWFSSIIYGISWLSDISQSPQISISISETPQKKNISLAFTLKSALKFVFVLSSYRLHLILQLLLDLARKIPGPCKVHHRIFIFLSDDLTC